MIEVPPGVANTVSADLVDTDGAAIESGTVNFYLQAMTGTHAGYWFKGSDSSWSATEQIAATGAHVDGTATLQRWTASIAAGAWIEGVRYVLEAHESNSLDIPTSQDVLCQTSTSGTGSEECTIDCGGVLAGGCQWWITATNDSQATPVQSGTANSVGVSTGVMLDPATYYLWRELAGTNFATQPQVLVVVP